MGKLGLGSLRFPRDANGNILNDRVVDIIDSYISSGGIYFEVGHGYAQTEKVIKELLVNRYDRSSYYLADKMFVNVGLRKISDWIQIFNEQLSICGVEYFDYYLIHNIGKTAYELCEKNEGFDFLKRIKQEGKVRNIGFSFHDSADVLDLILSKHAKDIDFVQLQINYFDWESPTIQSRKCYEVARKYHLPIFVMEPVKGGRIVDFIKTKQDVDVKKVVELFLRFAVSLVGVEYVLSGMSDKTQVLQNMTIEFKPLNYEEYLQLDEIVNFIKKVRKLVVLDAVIVWKFVQKTYQFHQFLTFAKLIVLIILVGCMKEYVRVMERLVIA